MSKALVMNVVVLAVGVLFFFIGRPIRALLISVGICLVVLNLVMIFSKPRG